MKNRYFKFFLVGLLTVAGIGGGYTLYDILKERGLSFNLHTLSGEIEGFENWITFKPKDENFSIAFPEKPEKEIRRLPIPGSQDTLPYKEYRCRKETHKLSVSYTILPSQWTKWSSGLILKGALRLILKETHGAHLTGKSSNKFQSHPALDYEHHKGNTETAGTLILIENILYKVEVSYPKHERESAKAEICQFIDSFKPAKSQLN